jgi:hypothetical protein
MLFPGLWLRYGVSCIPKPSSYILPSSTTVSLTRAAVATVCIIYFVILYYFSVLSCFLGCKPAPPRRLPLLSHPPPSSIVDGGRAHAHPRHEFFVSFFWLLFDSFCHFILFVSVQTGALASIALNATPPTSSHRRHHLRPCATASRFFYSCF